MGTATGPVQALVIVDVQVALVTGVQAVPGADRLLARIGGLLAAARQAGSLVIYLQNDGKPGTADEPGTPGWVLHLQPSAGEHVVRKTRDDGFDGTGLDRLLRGRRVGRLAVAGVLSEMCVSATARSALGKGYGVVLPHDAHASQDIAPAAGLGDLVPAAVVSRVAEWALGDEIELVASSDEVTFAAAVR